MFVDWDRAHRVAHPCRAWDAATLRSRSGWRMRVPAAWVDEGLTILFREPGELPDLNEFSLDIAKHPAIACFAKSLLQHLLEQEGVVWIRGLDDWGLTEGEKRLLYLALGMAMGDVVSPYGRLHSVEDRGVDYTCSAVPVSATSASTGFHTDSSSVDTCPDVVGLLCEAPSSDGGDSLISNALRAHRDLCLTDPEAIAVLQRPFIRDIVTPGCERSRPNLLRNRFPIFSGRSHNRTFRYMRYWIEQGQRRAGLPLDLEETAALDTLDRVLSAPENVIRLRLEKGDMLFIDNRILAHNRLAYRDAPGHTRRLQRIWIDVSRSGDPKRSSASRQLL